VRNLLIVKYLGEDLWLHDAKAAQVIGRLYFEGASRVWVEASEQQRSHDAIGRLYRLYQKQHQQQQNRLEAALQRHWPELRISGAR
jgi:hypothetical protein